MATKATKPVDPDAIDLLGRAKDAKLVVAYAAQAGVEAVPFLERAFREGSVAVRAAAAEALGHVAPDVGVRLAGGAVEELLAQKKPPKKELAALVQCLELVGSDAALDRVVALALAPKGPTTALPWDRATLPLVARVVDKLTRPSGGGPWPAPGLDDDAWRRAMDAFALPGALAAVGPTAEREQVRAFVNGLLDDPRATTRDKHEAARALFAWKDDEALAVLRDHAIGAASDALPDDIALAVVASGDPATAFDALSPRFLAGGVVRYRIAGQLHARSDRRWLDVARGLIDDDPRAAFDALLALGDVDTVVAAAGGATLDATTKQALHALGQRGEPRGAPLLRAWLARDEGKAVAPMLLAALAECGGQDDIAFLERRLASGAAAGATSSHEGFYRHAIARLQARA